MLINISKIKGSKYIPKSGQKSLNGGIGGASVSVCTASTNLRSCYTSTGQIGVCVNGVCSC